MIGLIGEVIVTMAVVFAAGGLLLYHFNDEESFFRSGGKKGRISKVNATPSEFHKCNGFQGCFYRDMKKSYRMAVLRTFSDKRAHAE